ncbi:MAG: nickel-dependent lactate racemase [Candidatus Krumholzibacteria bacterium]|nr:nickel-dependent lactate racemase [Candidatus Krumholzibacteria bacterium]
MRFALRYNDGAFDVDLAGRGDIRVVGDSYPAPLADPDRSFSEALEAPLGAKPLRKIIPPSGKISVLISDLTRGPSTGRMLARLLRFLNEQGVAPERVSVILALGMHRGSDAQELEAHLGAETLGRWKVVEHDARDPLALVQVGTTPAGTPCFFNRTVAESALVVALGTVSFHYFAGYGGGRKLILPGVAGQDTILANHRLSLRRDPGEGLSALCRAGNLDGNPVHEDMLAGARLLEARLFAINSVSDDRGNPVFVNAGEIDTSHKAACDFLSKNFRFPVHRRYRAVIASAGGVPKDINLLQSHKALRQASFALDEGGLMLAAAACVEGVGSESLTGAFEHGRQAVSDTVRKRYTLNSQTAMSTYELTGRFSIYLKSMLPDDLVERFGMCPWKDGYIDYLLDGVADEDILVIANASSFLPIEQAGSLGLG